jgi:hypothetical protein
MEVPRDTFNEIDDIQRHLRIVLAVSDLLTCMTEDPPMDNTIQEVGSLLVTEIERCLKTLESIRSSIHTIITGEYPNVELSDHQ